MLYKLGCFSCCDLNPPAVGLELAVNKCLQQLFYYVNSTKYVLDVMGSVPLFFFNFILSIFSSIR